MNYYQKALEFAKERHKGQLRKDRVPTITHPLAVDRLLEDIGITNDAVRSAALLHDVVEDNCATFQELYKEFSQKIVDYVHILTREDGMSRQQYMQRLANADACVRLIKLADVAHNSETIECLVEKNQQRMVDEIRDFYVPLSRTVNRYKNVHVLRKKIYGNAVCYLMEQAIIKDGPMKLCELKKIVEARGFKISSWCDLDRRFVIKKYSELLGEYEKNKGERLRKGYDISFWERIVEIKDPKKRKKQAISMDSFLCKLSQN